MKKLSKQLVAFLSLSILLLVCILASLHWLGNLSANAEEIDDIMVYNETNTYDAKKATKKIEENKKEYTYQTVSYDVTGNKNNVVVDTGDPMVTFVTHGYIGEAPDWSNDGSGNFAWTPDSIFETLGQIADKNLYLATFEATCDAGVANYDFILYHLDNHNYSLETATEKKHITDISKHSVVVFEADLSDQKNDFIYAQFNYLVSKVLYDLKGLNANKVPRINLIGHSRGGLTNLQYALDHPDIVDSMISIGTPYLGSTSADLSKMINLKSTDGPGQDDIVDPKVYGEYLSRWNKNYDRLYSKINVHAIGAYQSLDVLLYQLFYPYTIGNLEKDSVGYKSASFLLRTGIKKLLVLLNHKIVMYQSRLIPLATVVETAVNAFQLIFPDLGSEEICQEIRSFFEIIACELQYNNLFLGYDLLNDGAVNLSSQLGSDVAINKTYKGFRRHPVYFGTFSSFDCSKSASPDLFVTHLLEPRDSTILHIVANNIAISAPKDVFLVRDWQYDNCVSITGLVNKGIETTLEIPESLIINGREMTVVGIEANAFANLDTADNALSSDEQANHFRKVIIPSTVRFIGENAFYNNQYLEEVEFSRPTEAVITKIKERAFMNCSSLSSITLPSSLSEIGAFAFGGCSSLKGDSAGKFFLPSNLSNIEEGAFFECESIKEFAFLHYNDKYYVNKVVLYERNSDTLVCYPAGKKDRYFKVPYGHTSEIAAYAFSGNNFLEEVDLNCVNKIGEYAFWDCDKLSVITGPYVNFIAEFAFLGTVWEQQQGDGIAAIGGALYSYNGNDTSLDLSRFSNVTPFAFLGNESIKEVNFGDAAQSIGSFAFFGCSNLETIHLNGTNNVVDLGVGALGATSDELTIYVSDELKDAYASEESWNSYAENFSGDSSSGESGKDQHTHSDSDGDGVCDECGENIEGSGNQGGGNIGGQDNKPHTHVDADDDEFCDGCGMSLVRCGSVKPHPHEDSDNDGFCDSCFENMQNNASANTTVPQSHCDDDGNGYCDYCGTRLSVFWSDDEEIKFECPLNEDSYRARQEIIQYDEWVCFTANGSYLAGRYDAKLIFEFDNAWFLKSENMYINELSFFWGASDAVFEFFLNNMFCNYFGFASSTISIGGRGAITYYQQEIREEGLLIRGLFGIDEEFWEHEDTLIHVRIYSGIPYLSEKIELESECTDISVYSQGVFYNYPYTQIEGREIGLYVVFIDASYKWVLNNITVYWQNFAGEIQQPSYVWGSGSNWWIAFRIENYGRIAKQYDQYSLVVCIEGRELMVEDNRDDYWYFEIEDEGKCLLSFEENEDGTITLLFVSPAPVQWVQIEMEPAYWDKAESTFTSGNQYGIIIFYPLEGTDFSDIYSIVARLRFHFA